MHVASRLRRPYARTMTRLLPLALIALVGCGKGTQLGDTGSTTTLTASCNDGAPPDTYVAGIERTTTNGFTVRLADANPAPPDVGLNTFTIEVDGAAGSMVRLRPWMPLHGHGTVPEWHVATDNGTSWEIADLDLFMAGLWELRFTVDSEDQDTGALFRFCLEG